MNKEVKTIGANTSVARHPVVVVLGHVDHGKTTLLDYIRKTNVAGGESGGITQHLGAYEIIWHGKKITFLDTPGHETFSKIRERGARVADVAILVIAADDGVKPQTKEAYEIIQKAKIPFVVALNKVDKPTAEPDRVKAGLAEIGILVEGWGGSVPCTAISAKGGTHIGELLDTVLLVAELEELRSSPDVAASGVVIEAHLDSRRGPSATLLLTDGVLQKGDFVLAADTYAPVRIFEDALGNPIETAFASTPVRVVGFTKVPAVGASFVTYHAKEEIEKNLKARGDLKKDTGGEIGILIKADVAGSLEALEDQVKKIVPKELAVKFDGGVGDIAETDVKTISAAKKAFIIGFRVKVKPSTRELADRLGVSVEMFEIIYEAIDWAKKTLGLLVPKKVVRVPLGKLLVLKVFQASAGGRVIGGRVREGKIPNDAEFEILRNDTPVARGKVANIERSKIKVNELREGEEGGLLVHVPKAIEERDTLSFFYEREAE